MCHFFITFVGKKSSGGIASFFNKFKKSGTRGESSKNSSGKVLVFLIGFVDIMYFQFSCPHLQTLQKKPAVFFQSL